MSNGKPASYYIALLIRTTQRRSEINDNTVHAAAAAAATAEWTGNGPMAYMYSTGIYPANQKKQDA